MLLSTTYLILCRFTISFFLSFMVHSLEHALKFAAAEDAVSFQLLGRAAQNSTEFSWLNIAPSTALDDWVPCYGGFECARLSVPMNWAEANSTMANTSRVAIAITKLPAQVPENSTEWRGPILLNNGGPGGSGAIFALSAARALQNLLGPEFSIIGFDPRGVNNTTPAISCFSNPLQRSVWGVYNQDVLEKTTVAAGYARSKALGSVCEPMVSGNGGGSFVNTPSVARDMLAITEALWTAAGAKNATEKGLLYWGLSYGSVLGMTFATMFPDRVHRVVVDGVLDINDYYSGELKNILQNATAVSDRFFSYCSRAGPQKCLFYGGEPTGTIREKLTQLIDRLQREPLPVTTTLEGPDVVSSSDILVMLFVAFYKPLLSFPILAEALSLAEQGQGADVIDRIRGIVSCAETPGLPNTGAEVTTAIICSDAAEPANNLTLSEFEEYLHFLNSQSPYSGPNWAKIRLGCQGWKARPEGLVHSGPWGATTKEGVLFVGNVADPVTPVVNARNMHKLFPNSGLLVQNGEGHCSLAQPSICSGKVIRSYFRNGTLPHSEDGAYCEVDEVPFGLPALGFKNGTGSVEDQKLAVLVKAASDVWAPAAFGPRRS